MIEHEAYEATPLISLSSQVESIAAHNDCLLIGTRQGFLFMYQVEPGTDEKYNVQLMRLNKAFSKKAVTQLEIIPEYQLLVALTDNVIQLHDLNSINFNLISHVQPTKGATYFTLNIKKEKSLTGQGAVLIRMAVVVKRKLQLYYLKNNDFNKLCDDINLSEVPRSILWSQESICIGYKGEYALVDLLDKNKHTELFPTSGSRSSEPCMVKVSEKAFALCRDSQTVLVNIKGEAEVATALKWSDVPITIAWDEPYAIAATPDKVEVKTPDGSLITQTLNDLVKVRFLVCCRQGLVYAASLSQVWAVTGVNIAKQRKILLDIKQFQLALKLTSVSDECEEDKKEKVHHIQTLLAYDLFTNKHFRESMEEFQKLKTDPYDVIRLFPELLPKQPGDNQVQTVEALVGKDLETGLLALIDYLTDVRHPLKLEVANKDSKSKNALHLLQIIDTTLLKCYLQTNEALVAPLLRLNYCHLAEAEKVLKKMGRNNELIILYQTKGQHRKALELLKSEKAVEKTIKYLQNLSSDQVGLILEFADWVLAESPEDGLRIFIDYNQECGQLPKPRVLDFLLRSHPKVVIPYLEHVVHVWKDTNSLFHNALIHQYRERSIDEQTDLSRRLLLEFLEKSQDYVPESVLAQFPNEGFIEEKAIILGRLGRHDQALSIYIRVLNDIDKALKYCEKVYNPNSNKNKGVYVTLLKLILNPDYCTTPSCVTSPKKSTPDVELVLKVMEEHASRLDPLETLATLPDNVPVARIRSFLLTALQKSISERRRAELLKGLLYAEHLQCQEAKSKLQSQKVLITELNVCPVCKKRFGNQSALVRYPNGDVVHYSCQDKKL